MRALLVVLDYALQLYMLVVLAMVIMSWLLQFNVVNYHNPFVRSVWNAVTALTEPVLGRIRRFMPNLGAIDISPIVLFLIVIFLRELIAGALRSYPYAL